MTPQIEIRDPKLGDREQMRFECLRLAGGDLKKARELVNFVEGMVTKPPVINYADQLEGVVAVGKIVPR